MSFWESHFLWRDVVIAAAAVAAVVAALGLHATLRRVVFLPAAVSQLAGAGVVTAFLIAHIFLDVRHEEAPDHPLSHLHGHVEPAAGEAAHGHGSEEGLHPEQVEFDDEEFGAIPMADDPGVFEDEESPSVGHPPSLGSGVEGGDPTSPRLRRASGQGHPPSLGSGVEGGHGGNHCGCPEWLPRLLAILFACGGALLLGYVREGRRVTREWLLGAAYIGASALIILVGGFIRQELHDISDVLFGNAIMIDSKLMIEALAISGVVLAFLFWLAPAFHVHAFDPTTARAHGVPVRLLDGLLFLSMGLAVATGTRVLGALPVFAFSVFPGMAALLLVKGARWLIALSALLGAVGAFVGYWASFVLSLPTGASMAAVSFLIFLLAYPIRLLRRSSVPV